MAQSRSEEDNILLEVKNLSVEFVTDGVRQPTVTDVSFHLKKGELLSLVGESGCGKSISCLSLARLLPSAARIVSGEIILHTEQGDVDILKLPPKDLRKIRGGEMADRIGGFTAVKLYGTVDEYRAVLDSHGRVWCMAKVKR